MSVAMIATLLLMLMTLTGLAIDLEYHAPQTSYATVPRTMWFHPQEEGTSTTHTFSTTDSHLLVVCVSSYGEKDTIH